MLRKTAGLSLGLLVGMLAWVIVSWSSPSVGPVAPQDSSALNPGTKQAMLRATRVLDSTPMIQLEESEWISNGERGWVWLVLLPRQAKLSIQPSVEVQPLSSFSPLRVDGVQVNGGFYDNGAMGLVRHAGVVHALLTEVGGSGVVWWTPKDGLQVSHREEFNGSPMEALQSIDRLVDGGRSLVRTRSGVPETARVAVGHSDEHVLVAIAGSWRSTERLERGMKLGASEHSGLPLWAFADLLVELGFQRALNLDGGISTEAIVRMAGTTYQVRGGVGTINAVVVVP